jgi:hypothetical protein
MPAQGKTIFSKYIFQIIFRALRSSGFDDHMVKRWRLKIVASSIEPRPIAVNVISDDYNAPEEIIVVDQRSQSMRLS